MKALVHIVDPDSLFRAAIGRLLQTCGYEVALHEGGKHFARQAVDETRPGCIILECRMPEMSGVELQRWLIESGLILPVIFLTANGDIPTSVLAIKNGAEDFLTKPVAKKKLLAAIESALSKWRTARDQRDRFGDLRASANALTPRERIVLKQLVSGKLSKQIAFELGISERTVKAHRQSIKSKLKVRSFAALVSAVERTDARRAGIRFL
jgi:FixJ family two-component response regulator